MTNPSIQQNTFTCNDPGLAELMTLMKADVMTNLNCHHIGVIQSFDAAKQTATVTIAYKKTIFQANPQTGVYAPVLINYPLLADCPVICLGGGSAALTFPIKQGDECLVLFNDRDIDNWFQAGQIGPNATPRAHSIADGFALVGIRSLNSVLTGYDSTHATLRNGSMGVGVSNSLIKLYNATTTLGTLMQQMLTQLQTLANTPAVPSSPINPAVATQLASIATDLSNLLE
jgi:hypothetical protein